MAAQYCLLRFIFVTCIYYTHRANINSSEIIALIVYEFVLAMYYFSRVIINVKLKKKNRKRKTY